MLLDLITIFFLPMVYLTASMPLQFDNTEEGLILNHLKSIASEEVKPDYPKSEYSKKNYTIKHDLDIVMRILGVDYDFTLQDTMCCLRLLLPDSFSIEDETKAEQSIIKEIKSIQGLLKRGPYMNQLYESSIKERLHLILKELRKKTGILSVLHDPHIVGSIRNKKNDNQCTPSFNPKNQIFKCSKLQEHEKDYENKRQDEIFETVSHIVYDKLETDKGELRTNFLEGPYMTFINTLMRIFQFKITHRLSSFDSLTSQMSESCSKEKEVKQLLIQKIQLARKSLTPLIFDMMFMTSGSTTVAKEVSLILNDLRLGTHLITSSKFGKNCRLESAKFGVKNHQHEEEKLQTTVVTEQNLVNEYFPTQNASITEEHEMVKSFGENDQGGVQAEILNDQLDVANDNGPATNRDASIGHGIQDNSYNLYKTSGIILIVCLCLVVVVLVVILLALILYSK